MKKKKRYLICSIRAAAVPQTAERSLGLGLALCRSIITSHGGTISVSDNIPNGTVVSFTLPIGEVDLNE
ncbi:MAG: ATP-binding protein [Ruminococcus sp.]